MCVGVVTDCQATPQERLHPHLQVNEMLFLHPFCDSVSTHKSSSKLLLDAIRHNINSKTLLADQIIIKLPSSGTKTAVTQATLVA